jgi:polyribonucleotide nucleotidyltransferase
LSNLKKEKGKTMSLDQSVEIGGKKINFNTGLVARQADGAVVVTCGETVVLATAVAAKKAKEGQDFFPLSVEYREKYYASGRFPGGYIKREGRPGDHEILVCRITDRPLRPLFPKDFVNDVQIIISVLASDKEELPDILAINAASAALSVSQIPFHGPVGAVRVGLIGGNLVLNPTATELAKSDLNLAVAGTEKAVTMIEGESANITEDQMLAAVEFAHNNIKTICRAQSELKAKAGKPVMSYEPRPWDSELEKVIREKFTSEIDTLGAIREKKAREEAFDVIAEKVKVACAEQFPDTIGLAKEVVHDIDRDIVRKKITVNGDRPDGRALEEIRPITIKPDYLPRVHGSALFTRGQTQSLGIVTLGSESDVQYVDMMNGEIKRRFMLHYNFPPFSVGETGRFGGQGRREIGHGMLAERSLAWAIPGADKFPYTIRVVSEILESNGSSSMATVCSGSLAMFSAGVPLKAPIAGIAMGLVMEEGKFAILSDIQGIEDHLGDMDFKVAGTAEGITAFQLDIKVEGITPEIMRLALAQAKKGRLHILGKMNEALPAYKPEMSPYAPRIVQINIPQDKIGELIGPGGKMIKRIVEESGAQINIDDSGVVTIAGVGQVAIDKAVGMVRGVIDEVEEGAVYEGTVKRIVDFGAFVEIIPGKEGLLHISKIAHQRINKVTDVLNLGDKLQVKVLSVDRNGKIDLSRRDLIKKESE